MTAPNGAHSSVKTGRGALREFTLAKPPLELQFEFNPTSMTRTRTVTIKSGTTPGTRGGYDFADASEVPRVAQGVTVNAETFSLKILLDATDRMNAGDPQASQFGVQPEIDILRSMLEPKNQTPEGARTLAALGQTKGKAFSYHQFASVLLFEWGVHTLPVFMTQANIVIKAFLPNLFPYRAEADLSLQVIESKNSFYEIELQRQFAMAGGLVTT